MVTLAQAVLSNALVVGGAALVLMPLGRLNLLRHRPAIRQALWLMLLVKLATPPLFHVPIPEFEIPQWAKEPLLQRAPTPDESSPLAFVPPANSTAEFDWAALDGLNRSLPSTADHDRAASAGGASRWMLPVVGGAWFMGTVCLVVRLWSQSVRIRKTLRAARDAPDDWSPVLAEACRHMSVHRPPRLCIVDAVVSPMLCLDPLAWVRTLIGVNRPHAASTVAATIVVPQSLACRLDPHGRLLVLAHELAHVKRFDPWINLFTALTAAVFWWHPSVWIARREIGWAQETCCDALVLDRFARSRRQYANVLLDALDFVTAARVEVPSLANGLGKSRSLKRRIEMVAERRLSHRLAWWSWPLLASAVILLPWGFLPAQAPPPPAPGGMGGTPPVPVAPENTLTDPTQPENQPPPPTVLMTGEVENSSGANPPSTENSQPDSIESRLSRIEKAIERILEQLGGTLRPPDMPEADGPMVPSAGVPMGGTPAPDPFLQHAWPENQPPAIPTISDASGGVFDLSGVAVRYLDAVMELKLARSRAGRLDRLGEAGAGAVAESEREEARLALESATQKVDVLSRCIKEAYDTAQLDLTAAKQRYAWISHLVTKGYAPESELGSAEAAYARYRSRLRTLESILSHGTSPASDSGNTVQPPAPQGSADPLVRP
jgi:beta-lactamase regulating signal transducer with metallopeptidase domain